MVVNAVFWCMVVYGGVVYGGVWWCMVVYGGVWWCMVVYGGVWWCKLVSGGARWCMVVCNVLYEGTRFTFVLFNIKSITFLHGLTNAPSRVCLMHFDM